MYKVLAIGDTDFCAGFALAGIETQCANTDQFPQALAQAKASGHYGIVIIDQSNEGHVDNQGAHIPVVVSVPAGMQWRDVEKLGEDTYIAAMIRQAIGYQLDINL